MAGLFSKSSILVNFIDQEILNTQFLVIFFLALLGLYFWRKDYELKQLIPVPWNIPVVGSLPWVVYSLFRQRLPVYELLRRLRYSYGSIYALNICGTIVVILNDFSAIKKAMDSPYVSDRPNMNGKAAEGHKGLVLANGQTWSQQRNFTQATFRSFGVGTNSSEDKVVLESHALIDELTKQCVAAEPFDLENVLANAMSNVICAMVFGQRFDYADKKFTYFQHLAMQQTKLGRIIFPEIYIPILGYIPSKKREALIQNRDELLDFVGEIVKEHEHDIDANHLRGYIDVYINELRKEEKDKSSFAKLEKSNMLNTVCQLFSAGTDSTAQTIRWGLTYLVAYPHIQKRVRKEIDDVVGRNRLPKLSDKPTMPYTCATIFEIQRMTHTRLAGPHKCSKAISLAGVTIPKDAIVVANVYAVHRDPELWTDPDVFNPERFIKADGEVHQPKELIPFNIGRRMCLGDKLARMELFIFLSHLLHQFTFEPPSSSDQYPDPGIQDSPANPCMRIVKRD